MEVSTKPPEPGEKNVVRVTREDGTCEVCGVAGPVIRTHDDRVMNRLACSKCVLDGKAANFAPEHPAMRPIVFVARALRGDEPFRTLLASAEHQRAHPEAYASAIAEQKAIADAKQRASDIGDAMTAGKTGRAARRAADAVARIRRKRAKV